ncbi:S-adenosyl-l-methionine hydroxide adenosyltransferase family protein [Candidatus Bathyarchaeota archaeon]|nr:S-adenosyl-l-methionine hydroxide adenosyltransferase family protein [Candidatus Bathyarchaeota archaeon]
MTIISLLTDFGQKDPYVAEMKAVILSINHQACIIDISHEISKFNIKMGAYFLASATPFFPIGSIHMVVVDPGVGTNRRGIIIETQRSLYVGPDNGVLMLAAKNEIIKNVFTIDNPKYFRSKVSNTFHGRDIFAPVAAYLSMGIKLSELGQLITDYIFPEFIKPYENKGDLFGVVIHIDDFGNIITNISVKDIERYGIQKNDSINFVFGDKRLNLKLCSTYGNVPVGSPLALIGSSNFFEIAVNQGNASKFFNTKVDDSFCISRFVTK